MSRIWQRKFLGQCLPPCLLSLVVLLFACQGRSSPIVGMMDDRDQSKTLITLPPGLANQLKRRRMPGREALLYLANNVVKDCIAITLHWNSLVIELPLVERSDFLKNLEKLPYAIHECECSFEFHNGPLPGAEHYRVEQPQALLIHAKRDETDYVAYAGVFYPGTMVSSMTKYDNISRSVTAGILVEKEDQ